MENNDISANGQQASNVVSNAEFKLYTFSDFSYDTGFADGALRLGELRQYETFSTHLEKKELAEALLTRCRHEMDKLNAELDQLKHRTLELYATIFDREEKLNFTGVRLEETKQKKEEFKSLIQSLESRRRLIEPENSWVVASIVVLSGFVFILADILITEEILEKVLSMTKFEAWTIAVSISLTVFGVKPLIDRIFERPRWESDKVLRNNVLLIVTGVFILLMLALLGFIRVKGYKIILTNSSMEEWAKIFSDPTLYGIFILASMLFAVVGALCLSIGFRSAEQNAKRWILSNKSKKIERLLSFQESRSFELQEMETKIRKELREAQKELELQPVKSQLDMRLVGLEVEEKDLMIMVSEANATAQAAWYSEGVARGERFNVSGELYVSPIRMERWVVPESIQGPYQSRTPRDPRNQPPPGTEKPKHPAIRNDEHLYQQIRNAIALHDNRTNKKSFSNGKQS